MTAPWEDRWTKEKTLGQGAQGVAELVTNKATGKRGAVKYLKNNKDAQARSRVLREVSNLKLLHQLGAQVPNVIEHNSDAVDDPKVRMYLIMEFIDGPSLETFINSNGCVSLDDALRFALNLCLIVKTAHGVPIVHRDIKPSNIIVSDPDNGGLYIVDYGLSCAGDDTDLTQTSETFKSKFLALPEGTTPGGDRRDLRSDVTAICAVLYYMLTGHVIGQLADHNARPPHLRPGYSLKEALPNDARRPQLDMILNRGLAHDIQMRFQTIDDLIERLTALQGQSADLAHADPVAFAKEAKLHLRQHSRTTQLGIFRPKAQNILDKFRTHIDQVTRNITPFSIRMATGGWQSKTPFKGDELTNQYSVTLALEHHGQVAFRCYRIVAVGEQAVLIAGEADGNNNGKDPNFGDWTEIAWFPAERDGVPEDLLLAFDSELRAWLFKCMQTVMDKVLAN